MKDQKLEESSIRNNFKDHQSTEVTMNGHLDSSLDDAIHVVNKTKQLDEKSCISNGSDRLSTRILKRRRKWGSFNRLFSPKRRRDYLNRVNTFKSKCGLLRSSIHCVKSKIHKATNSNLGTIDTLIKTSESNVQFEHGTSNSTNELSNLLDSDDSNQACLFTPDDYPSNDSSLANQTSKSIPDEIHSENHTSHYLCEWDCCMASFEFKQQVCLEFMLIMNRIFFLIYTII